MLVIIISTVDLVLFILLVNNICFIFLFNYNAHYSNKYCRPPFLLYILFVFPVKFINF